MKVRMVLCQGGGCLCCYATYESLRTHMEAQARHMQIQCPVGRLGQSGMTANVLVRVR
jgi:hypothetical protein